MFDWWVEIQTTRDEWKFFTMEPGEQFVMVTGILETLSLFAVSLDFQVRWQQTILQFSGEDREEYGWMTYYVQDTRVHWQSVITEVGEDTIVITVRMQAFRALQVLLKTEMISICVSFEIEDWKSWNPGNFENVLSYGRILHQSVSIPWIDQN